MKNNITKIRGINFNRWVSYLPNDSFKKIRFKVWRDYYNDNLTPYEACMKEGITWVEDNIQKDI
tara:strand:+ start:978 stop:1169 length:192 start_codon:yes stop_codon:yes gene_type:complete